MPTNFQWVLKSPDDLDLALKKLRAFWNQELKREVIRYPITRGQKERYKRKKGYRKFLKKCKKYGIIVKKGNKWVWAESGKPISRNP